MYRGADLRYALDLDLEQAVSGDNVSLTIPTMLECRECGGSGSILVPRIKLNICAKSALGQLLKGSGRADRFRFALSFEPNVLRMRSSAPGQERSLVPRCVKKYDDLVS